jgi:hypothetical protein
LLAAAKGHRVLPREHLERAQDAELGDLLRHPATLPAP